jgi:hypothetical protein
LAKIWGLCNEKTGSRNVFQFLKINLINVGTLDKAGGPGKKSKTNKRRAYVYFGV